MVAIDTPQQPEGPEECLELVARRLLARVVYAG
jgi:hypothetical protein